MRPTRLSSICALAAAFLSLGVCPIPAGAQTVVGAPAALQPAGAHLTAQGHAEVKAPADIAYLTISVSSEASRQAAAAQDNAARTTALVAQIRTVLGPKRAGRDIQTTDYTAQRRFNTNGPNPVLIGFQVTNTVQVTFHDLGQVSRLIDLAAGSGATAITGLTYSLVNRQAAQGRALTLAVTDARMRGEAIASALGMTLGALRSVNDSAGPMFQAQNVNVMNNSVSNLSAGGTPISPQEIVVTADVTLDYNLADK